MGDREQQPTFVRPMLLTSDAVPDGDRWTLELRWDGCRAHIRYDGHSVSLRTRIGRECAAEFPELASIAGLLGPASQSILVAPNRGGGEMRRLRMSWAGAGRRVRPVVLLGSLIAVLVCALAVAGTTAAARTSSKQPRVVPSDPARLALLNSSFPRVVRAGQVINYTLRLANVGNAPALRVRLCDRPPLGVVVTLAPRFARVGRLFCTTIPVLRTLGHRTFHLRARARLVTRGIVVNRAVATAGNAGLVRSRARTLVVAPAPLVTG